MQICWHHCDCGTDYFHSVEDCAPLDNYSQFCPSCAMTAATQIENQKDVNVERIVSTRCPNKEATLPKPGTGEWSQRRNPDTFLTSGLSGAEWTEIVSHQVASESAAEQFELPTLF